MKCLTRRRNAKSGKSKDWKEEEGRKFEKEAEHRLPAANSLVDREKTQNGSQGQNADSICNVCPPVKLRLDEFDFEAQLVQDENCDESPSENASKEPFPGKYEAGPAFQEESHGEAGLVKKPVEAEESKSAKELRVCPFQMAENTE